MFLAGLFGRIRRAVDPQGAVLREIRQFRESVRNDLAQHARELEGVRDDARGAYQRIGHVEGQVDQLRTIVTEVDDRLRSVEGLPDAVGSLEERLEAMERRAPESGEGG